MPAANTHKRVVLQPSYWVEGLYPRPSDYYN